SFVCVQWPPQATATLTASTQSGGRVFPHRHALVLEHLLQLVCLKHLAHDVAAADELALHIELGDRRPVRVGLYALTQLVRFEHVQPFEGHAEVIENLHHLTRKTAHRELRCAFHKQHDVVGFHFAFNELLDAHQHPSCASPAVIGRRSAPRHVSRYVAHLRPNPKGPGMCRACYEARRSTGFWWWVRLWAVPTSEMCENACGKLPTWRPRS